jgi:glycosyltransferase involved in cell wall biosynthesis
MIDALSRVYAVDVVVADEPSDPMPGSFAALIDTYAAFPREARNRGGVRRAMLAARPNESLFTAGWTNAAMRNYVAERLGRFPYVAIQTDLPMIGTLPRRDTIPVVYNAHNCESALLERRAPLEPPHIGALLALDAHRVRHLEKKLIGRSALVTACAEADIRDFERFAADIREKAVVIPNGVDVGQYHDVREAQADPATVLITGSMDWRPNILGLDWFLEAVLPILRARVPHVVVRVAGRMHPDLAARLALHANVEAVPNPKDTRDHLARATVVAAPILASSGTRLRILEAWAAGRPVVTTKAGAFGLAGENCKELLIADAPSAFAASLAAAIDSRDLREQLVSNAASGVISYDWRTVGTQLLNAYDRLSDDVPMPRKVTAIREEVVLSANT